MTRTAPALRPILRWPATMNISRAAPLTLMGASQLIAGNKIELSGFGQLSGPWLITTARHTLDRSSGYVTELDVARDR